MRLAVWYFLKEFPPSGRAEPPWAPRLSDPHTDLVLLTEVKESEFSQRCAALLDLACLTQRSIDEVADGDGVGGFSTTSLLCCLMDLLFDSYLCTFLPFFCGVMSVEWQTCVRLWLCFYPRDG